MHKISIFTPTHNTQYLQAAYDSIKNQEFFEWIILLNGDAKDPQFNDERVKVFQSPFVVDPANPASDSHKWVGRLKGHAAALCTGDVLLEFDHDDLLTSGALAEVTKAFDDPDVGFVYSNTIHMFGEGQKIARFDERYGWKYREVDFNGYKLDEHLHFEPTPSCISKIWFAPNHLRAFRKDVYSKIGGYNQDMRILDDLDLMCRMYAVTKFHHIDKGLYVYRVHGKNTWQDPAINAEIQNNVFRIHDQYIESLAEKWADDNKLLKLELGGRMNAKPGYTTVDMHSADVVCDLNERWPFEDGSVGVVRSFDVFEHLRDSVHTMNELYRVLAPGAFAFIQVPSTDGRGAWQAPDHVSFWNYNSFF
jgi:glycosyltransferase involved in cell wall biosynthesis